MSRGSPELTDSRKEEILNAFEKLFQNKSFRSISMHDIEQEISMTRSSIYNYFKTKEEILIGLIYRKLTVWMEELRKIENNQYMTVVEFSSAMADLLENSKQMLKLVSWNHTELEENSRAERIAEIQSVTYEAMVIFSSCLDKFFPTMPDDYKKSFQLSFFTLLYGLDSFSIISEKQLEAFKISKVPYYPSTVREIVYNFMMQFLGGF